MNLEVGDLLTVTPEFILTCRTAGKHKFDPELFNPLGKWLKFDTFIVQAIGLDDVEIKPLDLDETHRFPINTVAGMRQAYLVYQAYLDAQNSSEQSKQPSGRGVHGWLELNVVSPDGTKERIRFDAVSVAPADTFHMLMTIEETANGRSEAISLLLTPSQQRGLRDYLNDLLEGE